MKFTPGVSVKRKNYQPKQNEISVFDHFEMQAKPIFE
jgi:hypothetical protein